MINLTELNVTDLKSALEIAKERYLATDKSIDAFYDVKAQTTKAISSSESQILALKAGRGNIGQITLYVYGFDGDITKVNLFTEGSKFFTQKTQTYELSDFYSPEAWIKALEESLETSKQVRQLVIEIIKHLIEEKDIYESRYLEIYEMINSRIFGDELSVIERSIDEKTEDVLAYLKLKIDSVQSGISETEEAGGDPRLLLNDFQKLINRRTKINKQ